MLTACTINVVCMGAYKYIAQTLQKQYKERDGRYREKMIAWRNGPVMERIEWPSNLARARRLGYKPKQGYAIVRIRMDKGRRRRQKPDGGRKPKSNYLLVQPGRSHQTMAEQRVNRAYRNMEVLNSYWVGEDGMHKFFEVILADPSKPSVNVSSVSRQGKSFRGLTSSGQKGRPSSKWVLNKKLRRRALRGVPPADPYAYENLVKKPKEPVEIRTKDVHTRRAVKREAKSRASPAGKKE